MGLVHAFVSSKADGGDATLVRPSDWNADHSISGQAQGDLIYRSGTEWTRLAAGTNRQALLTSGASANPVWGDVAMILAREATLISIVSSVAETDIFNFTVPANAMGSNRMLRLTLLGDRLNNSGAAETAPTFRVYTGGTVRYQDTGTALASSATRRVASMVLHFAMQNATNTMIMSASAVYSGAAAAAATTGIGDFAGAGNTVQSFAIASDGTFTQDTTSNWALRVSWQNGTNAATVEFRRHYAVLELV